MLLCGCCRVLHLLWHGAFNFIEPRPTPCEIDMQFASNYPQLFMCTHFSASAHNHVFGQVHTMHKTYHALSAPALVAIDGLCVGAMLATHPHHLSLQDDDEE